MPSKLMAGAFALHDVSAFRSAVTVPNTPNPGPPPKCSVDAGTFFSPLAMLGAKAVLLHNAGPSSQHSKALRSIHHNCKRQASSGFPGL